MSEQQTKQEAVITEIMESVTQREKLQVSQALDAPYTEVMESTDKAMLALAWLQRKHKTGGANWDEFLDMTDKELLVALGIYEDEDAEAPLDGSQPVESGPESEPVSA